jgi:hypothetical protein
MDYKDVVGEHVIFHYDFSDTACHELAARGRRMANINAPTAFPIRLRNAYAQLWNGKIGIRDWRRLGRSQLIAQPLPGRRHVPHPSLRWCCPAPLNGLTYWKQSAEYGTDAAK